MNENVKNRLKIEIKKAYYTSKRYAQETTFAILHHDKELEIDILGKMVRVSDLLIKIDENHYFIFFKFTNQTQAFKASENVLLELDNYFNTTNSCIGLDAFDINKSPTIVINRLMQILNEVKKNKFLRIEDENILNDMV